MLRTMMVAAVMLGLAAVAPAADVERSGASGEAGDVFERYRRELKREEERERARRELVDALPLYKRAGAELCRQAGAVAGMVVDASRGGVSERRRHWSGSDVDGGIIVKRRYLPAAFAEVTLKLSRLARDLMQEAERFGYRCTFDKLKREAGAGN